MKLLSSTLIILGSQYGFNQVRSVLYDPSCEELLNLCRSDLFVGVASIRLLLLPPHSSSLVMDFVKIQWEDITVTSQENSTSAQLPRIAAHGVFRIPASYLGSPILRVMMSNAPVNWMGVNFRTQFLLILIRRHRN